MLYWLKNSLHVCVKNGKISLQKVAIEGRKYRYLNIVESKKSDALSRRLRPCDKLSLFYFVQTKHVLVWSEQTCSWKTDDGWNDLPAASGGGMQPVAGGGGGGDMGAWNNQNGGAGGGYAADGWDQVWSQTHLSMIAFHDKSLFIIESDIVVSKPLNL